MLEWMQCMFFIVALMDEHVFWGLLLGVMEGNLVMWFCTVGFWENNDNAIVKWNFSE